MDMSRIAKILPPFLAHPDLMRRRSDAVFGLIVLLGVAAVCLAVIDGYVFYSSQMRASAPAHRVERKAMLTELEIDQALRLLDSRAEKLEALLGGE